MKQMRWRQVLPALSLAGWFVLAYLAGAGMGPLPLRVAVALAPFLVAAVALLGRSPVVWLGLALALAAAGVALLLRGHGGWLDAHVSWLFYLQHAGINLAFAAGFGRSLLPGREPVVTVMSRLISPIPLSPRKTRYGRGVTWAWTLFFIVNVVVSSAFFAWAPLALWSVYANLLTGPLVAAMFLLEMLVRRLVLPAVERPSLRDVWRAWQIHGRRTARTGV